MKATHAATSRILVFPPMTGVADFDLDYWQVIEVAQRESGGRDFSAVVLYPGASDYLRDRFADLSLNLHVSEGLVTADPSADRVHQEVFEVISRNFGKMLIDQRVRALRLAPSNEICTRRAMRVYPPREVEREMAAGNLDLIVFDPRAGAHEAFLLIDWSDPRIRAAAFVTLDVNPRTVDQLDRVLTSGGLQASGRLWGEAGSTHLYRRPSHVSEKLSCLVRQTKVDAGSAIVRVRERWDRASTPPEPLQSREAAWPGPIQSFVVEEVASKVGSSHTEWDVSALPEEPILEIAEEAHRELGVYPLSFSHPKPRVLRPNVIPGLSPIIPGFPYTFSDEDAYLETYASHVLGMTHRKAGWDCFRHVEIMAAGSIPLMIDVADIPRYSMIHYPKKALQMVLSRLESEGALPSPAMRAAFRDYFERHLSSQAMARYILKVAHVSPTANLVFLDDNLCQDPEYQSTLTAIGLKQVLGSRCVLRPHCEFLYSDSSTDTSSFYGRGFGYTRVLDPSLRSPDEDPHLAAGESAFAEDAVVVIGSVSRNRELTRAILANSSIKQIIAIHGEDSPPSSEDLELLRAPRVAGFVRSIHV